ncbi:MAG TPA: type II/IV secretion system ATPase subunit [archaeon]|nr:type II/IV secretion system ATPase subunit [archaeon]
MVFEVEVKEGTLRMDVMGSIFGFTVEDSDVIMAKVINQLLEEKRVTNIVLSETREYEYDVAQTQMLKEVAYLIEDVVRERKLLALKNFGGEKFGKYVGTWYTWLYNLITFQLRGDPIGAYVNATRELRHVRAKLETAEGDFKEALENYAVNVLLPLKDALENLTLIKLSKPYLIAYHIGDRKLYREILKPTVRPNFMFTKFMIEKPVGETVARYSIGDSEVEIFKIPGKVRHIYHIVPPEFRLSEEEYTLLDGARRILEERKPQELEIKEQERMRELFQTLSRELIRELAENYGFSYAEREIEKLATILTRYTAGLGVTEPLLADDRIQDIYLNPPLGASPLFIYHQDFEECETNLIPTKADGERLATRFKLLSERPLDEANPVLDTEITVPGGVARIAAINPRLSPDGLGFAIRRHRFKPWTFPLFMNEKMFDSLFAGLMWFVASYGRTVLIGGSRGAGKTSLLNAFMLQVLPYYRMITVEDTLEIAVDHMRKLGYNINRLKSRSVITRVELELPAEEVIRTALRLGDSCLFIGEVRSREAVALFEAMRIGAMANVVAGTVHGESTYGIYDRIVNDLGVVPTSFKAVDLVAIANKLKTVDGLRSFRRITELTEVRKHWKGDPSEEGGFVNLMEYSSRDDKLIPSDTLLNGESQVLNSIAMRVPGWAGRWDAVWDNINLRGRVLQTIVNIANDNGRKDLLEADNLVKANQFFHIVSEMVRKETGEVDANRVYNEWLQMFKESVK